MEYMERMMDDQITGAQISEEQLDIEAIAWAYEYLKRFGIHLAGVENAMMMDRLNGILHGA